MSAKSILVISDQHAPYHHIDTIDFLTAIKKKYKPDTVVNIGDEMDWHSISFHDSHPGLYSPSHELQVARKFFKELEKLFPRQYVMDSNHGSLVFRRALKHGIPKAYLRDYNDFLEVGSGWKWHDDLTIDTPLGKVYFCHGKSPDILKLAQSMGMSCVSGHYHSLMGVRWFGNSLGLYYGLQVGCMIDSKSLAFRYNKVQKARPIIGCSVIYNGLPIIEPFIKDKTGKWVGKLL